jgi:hypothetical protein
MDIYTILASKPHNPHHLNRYITFIHKCQLKNRGFEGYMEKHHICPKSLYPSYKCLIENSWNKALLTPRQHFIAHIILWKVYPSFSQMNQAIWYMSNGKWKKHNKYSILYENIKSEQTVIKSIAMKLENEKRVKNGYHHWLKDEDGNSASSARVKDGTHNLLGKNDEMKIFQNFRVQNCSHQWLGEKNPVHKKIQDGTHLFLSSEYQSNLQKKRIDEGNHHMLGGEIQRKTQRKRVIENKHHFQKSIPCVDFEGNRIAISSEQFYNQKGNKNTWKYVAFSSREGKKRIATKKLLESTL